MARELELWFWRVTDPATGRWFLTDMRLTARQAGALARAGCDVTVVPAMTSAEDAL
jgi:hypothetical protein